jgi:hypothetical protein
MTARETYSLEITAPNVATDCQHADCDEHYVVRSGGLWVRAFHNERDARIFATEFLELDEGEPTW